MIDMIELSQLDRWVLVFDRFLGFVVHKPARTHARNPSEDHGDHENHSLSETSQRSESAALMRVNHAGEICAQGLYDGQSLTAKTRAVQDQLDQARLEEETHLAWCEQRLKALNDRSSHLAPLWYLGSCVLGACSGLMGDAFSLGFVAETERQVAAHLDAHLNRISPMDVKSIAIIQQMKSDEIKHQNMALTAGGLPKLPYPIGGIMACLAAVMTTLAYWI